jgi:hypothetical protein
MLLAGAVGVFLEAAPWLVLAAAFWFGSLGLGVAAGLMILAHVVSAVALNRWAGRKILPGILTPITIPLAIVVLLRTVWLGWRRGGVLWRGTLYPSRELRRHKRVWLGARAKPTLAQP